MVFNLFFAKAFLTLEEIPWHTTNQTYYKMTLLSLIIMPIESLSAVNPWLNGRGLCILNVPVKHEKNEAIERFSTSCRRWDDA